MLRHLAAALVFLLVLTSAVHDAAAVSEAEKTFLSMYFTDEELVIVSATRSLKSITRVAENVEVVTKEDIELMNAHTVADALRHVNGLSVDIGGSGCGSIVMAYIQGSDLNHVAVFIDGIPLNWGESNTADTGLIPVQLVDRIEVIKGPASSAWGSSLGGVINIITKSPRARDGIGGMVQTSYGEKKTADVRVESSGRKGAFGYYLTAGHLEAEGFNPADGAVNRSLFAKVEYRTLRDTVLQLTYLHTNGDRGRGLFYMFDPVTSDSDRTEQNLGSISFRTRLGEGIDLDLMAYAGRLFQDYTQDIQSVGEVITDPGVNLKRGVSGKVVWHIGHHQIVVGSDYRYDKAKRTLIAGGEAKITKWAVYANDTMSFGPLTIIPGLRFDRTDKTPDFLSPSLGVTYELGKETLLRAYVARGFNDPSLGMLSSQSSYVAPVFIPNPDLEPEKVWSFQAGFETTALKYLWLKVAGFRHESRDGMEFRYNDDFTEWTFVNAGRSRRQGVEISAKSIPFYNFRLGGGATIIRAKSLDTDETLKNVPTIIVNLNLSYDDGRSFKGLLTAHHIMRNAAEYFEGRYASTIFDLSVIKNIYKKKDLEVSLFGSIHNIFSGADYWTTPYFNAPRWVEAGLRCRF